MGRRLIVGLIVLLIVAAGFAVVSVRLSRELHSSTDLEPPLYPSFLYGSFMVTEADTGISNPSAEVAVDLHYNEPTNFTVLFFLLNSTLEQFEQISDVSTLEPEDANDEENLVGWYGYSMEPPSSEFPLLNIPCNYVWVLWIETESIPESWTIDVTLTLNFSIL
ncbi:MAG: hypothetical protein ACXACG_18450 [Candidatus Thorarchaeota archaeon]|jgi:hypothetical protein